MFNNNTTFILRQPSLDTCTFALDAQLPILVVIFVLSPVTIVGNGLVLAAIWRNPSLRTPSYILLAGLALTDFCTGIISEPFLLANEVVNILVKFSDRNSRSSVYFTMRIIGDSSLEYFFYLTLLIMTLMSIERWMHMSHQSLLTVRRLLRIIVVLLFIPIPFVVYRFQDIFNFAYLFTNIASVIICLFVTSVAYIKVFRIIRRHQHQIRANESCPNFAQPAINLAKYKKSVFSIFYILVIFHTGYLPMVITLVLIMIFGKNCRVTVLPVYISIMLIFLSSSLNPLLYLWRMKDIRQEVIKVVKRIFCKEN